MNCREVMELVDALADGELSAVETRLMMDHFDQCADCCRAIEASRRLSANIKSLPPHEPPQELAQRIAASLAEGGEDPSNLRQMASSMAAYVRPIAAYGLAAAVGALALYFFLFQSLSRDFHDREIVSAHLRSLMGKEIIQIASTDRHVMGPWFGGKLDFAPKVRSLASEGFALLGARTDYLFDGRVAVVVYARREHKINLFIVPSNGRAFFARRSFTNNGFNIEDFASAGFRYVAISDLNRDELGMFADLISRSNDQTAD